VYSHSRFTQLTFLLGNIFTKASMIKRARILLMLNGLLLEPPHSCIMQDHRLIRLARSRLRQVAASWLSKKMRLNRPCLLQTSRHERAEAEQKLNKLTADNDQLVQRLVEMKATEVERMNEVNRTCDEMVSHPPVTLLHSSCLKDLMVLVQATPACTASSLTSLCKHTLSELCCSTHQPMCPCWAASHPRKQACKLVAVSKQSL